MPSHEGVELVRTGYREHYGRDLTPDQAREILEQMTAFFIIHIDQELEHGRFNA